jgi:(heptosyl)LPS beta-1,4-glucosyltransferase
MTNINKRETISVVIITHNEEDILLGCLESVKWADEIIIVDSNSNDLTIDISKKFKARIFLREFNGFSKQKNFGIDKTSSDWILTLDADERVSNDLYQEIMGILEKRSDKIAYSVPFKNIFLGKLMNYGGWNPEFHTRLFKNNMGKFDETKNLHEPLIIHGDIGFLQSPIYHLSHRTIFDNLSKTKEYAILESERLFLQNAPKVTIIKIIYQIHEHFFNRYIRAKGYKDGIEGFIEAIYQSFSQIFIIQAMLWERQRGKSTIDIYKEIDLKIKENKYDKK